MLVVAVVVVVVVESLLSFSINAGREAEELCWDAAVRLSHLLWFSRTEDFSLTLSCLLQSLNKFRMAVNK